MIYKCSKVIMLLSADVKEPKDSIKSCQEICESLSEFVIPALNSDDLRIISLNYNRETGRNPNDLLNEENPLSFANINHLQKIISNNRLWESYFKNDFVNLEEFSANMSIIVRIRHPIMHVREINISEAAVTPALWILERLRIS